MRLSPKALALKGKEEEGVIERLRRVLGRPQSTREMAERALWEALGKPQIPQEMAESMRKVGWGGTWYPERREITVRQEGNSFAFHFEPKVEVPGFSVSLWSDRVGISEVRFAAEGGRVFFRGEKGGVWTRRALALVRGLRPFFEVLGLGDLDEALETLEKGGRGFQKRGKYLLVWGEGPEEPDFLFRGKLFGDPLLDADFLRGREVTLRFPEVEVVLQGGGGENTLVHLGNNLEILGFGLRWRDQVFPERGGLFPIHLVDSYALDPDPIPLLLREMAHRALIEDGAEVAMLKANPSYRPRMKPLPSIVRGILEEIRASENPLDTLSKRGFIRKATLRSLAYM
jgi:hypothetical protein